MNSLKALNKSRCERCREKMKKEYIRSRIQVFSIIPRECIRINS